MVWDDKQSVCFGACYYLSVVMVAQLSEYTKNYWTIALEEWFLWYVKST